MKTSDRRIYHSLGEFLTDIRIIMSRWKEIRLLMRGKTIDSAFRERLMLAVTAVNKCRYCSYAHAREALASGIPKEEVEALVQGMFDGSPSEQLPALLYAQHWAEANGKPEAPVRDRVVSQYGDHTVRMIDLVLRMIRVGNLSGNTFDYLLNRISLGRLGS